MTCNCTDPASLADAIALLPHHLDTIVNVPAPSFDRGDPRAYTLAERAAAWHNPGRHGAGGRADGQRDRPGSPALRRVDRQRRRREPARRQPEGAVKAALSNWTVGGAEFFGTRGITINTVASGRGAQAGYEGLSTGVPDSADGEIARLALFLTTPAARHITGQTLHASHGALAHWD